MSHASLPDVNPIPWAEFTAEVMTLYAPGLRAHSTCTMIRSTLDQLTALGLTSTADLTAATVARFIASRPPEQSANTTYSYVARLRAICTLAEAQGYVRVSPFRLRRCWVRRGAPARKRHHTPSDVARCLALARSEVSGKTGWPRWKAHRTYVALALVAYTGLRKMEALRLRVEDVDLPGRVLWVRARAGAHLKTESSEAPVPLPDELVNIISEWLPCLALPAVRRRVKGPRPVANTAGTMDLGWFIPNAFRTAPWTGGSKGFRPLDCLKALGTRAGVSGLTFLSLRHTFATAAENLGLSELQIMRILRHSNPRTQTYYRHADLDSMREAVKRFGFEPPPPAPRP
jgi:integrase